MRLNIRSKYRKAYKVQTPFEKVTAGWDLESSNPEVKWYSDPSDPKRQMQVHYFIEKNNGDEKLQSVVYFKDNHLHREDGPAVINILDDRITHEVWYVNNKRHREDGPADIVYYDDGSIRSEEYFINDKRHREDGPAEIFYKRDGTIVDEWYYTHGKRTNSKEY